MTLTSKLYHEDALVRMEKIESKSIDLIIADPPYFNVINEEWDRRWKTEGDFLDWLDRVFTQFGRVLKDNGSAYVFCFPRMSDKTHGRLSKHLNVLNHIAWAKPNGLRNIQCRPKLRKYFTESERILFAESKHAKKAERKALAPLREYMNEWVRSGFTKKEAEKVVGTSSRHYFNESQWSPPSREKYTALKEYAASKGKEIYDRTYADLRHEYMVIRKQARRYFNVNDTNFFTDVWSCNSKNNYKGRHPCEKPDRNVSGEMRQNYQFS